MTFRVIQVPREHYYTLISPLHLRAPVGCDVVSWLLGDSRVICSRASGTCLSGDCHMYSVGA